MTLTAFPSGISSYGVPVLPGAQFLNPFGHTWFVDGDHGYDGNDGDNVASPWKTMQQVFNHLHSGDNIVMRGNIREQLVTPVQIFDVTIIGGSTRPRHADTTPAGGESGVSWRVPASGAVAGQANVRVLQQGWRFVNILFVMQGATAAGVEIVRNAGAGNAERDSSHCSVLGCRFAGAGIGIRSGVAGVFTEIPYNCEIAYNKFNDNTIGMSDAIGANSWNIHHNIFQACTSCITMKLRNSVIHENIVGSFTANANSGGIDLNGGGGLNIVTRNYLSGTYSNAGGYRVSNANDEWAGNFNTLAGGITVSDPA
jgi:hypothetical protein